MKRFLYILCFTALVLSSYAQGRSSHPQRTPVDIARKQTEMLVRELNITDSVLRDTLFRMHLKYANMRNENFTRADILRCMMLVQEELKNILSPEQFEAFMNRQLNHEPRSPHNPCNWIAPHPHSNKPPRHTYEEQHTPDTQSESQPPSHP